MKDKKKRGKIPFFSSLQGKYAMSYLAILTVVLVLLNTYPLIASQDLLFRSKRDSLSSQTTVMSSALMELESLTSTKVERVMDMLNRTDLSHVIITDASGLVLYNSATQHDSHVNESDDSDAFQYALCQELVLALQGYDVAYSRYVDKAFISSAATPIIYRGVTIGAVYMTEIDTAQGALLSSLQENLRNISVIIVAIALVMSTLFSTMLTGRISALLSAIRIVGQGEYGHRLNPSGKDELAHLAEEFNVLTDRLQTTEEVRRRFVSDASHELKTPLASIRLLTDSILQNSQMDEEIVRDFVGDIGQEAGRLTRITEHLLLLTKLDSLPGTTACSVPVAHTIARVSASLLPVAEAVSVTLVPAVQSRCTVQCTPDDLHQIVFNLMENAIKYNIPNGKVMVYVESQGDEVYISVADTGLGIPQDDLPKIFNRFYRVDKARSRAAGGTGLGLSIVRDTVRRHGGWITATPRQPEGTIFTVGLPRGDEEVRIS